VQKSDQIGINKACDPFACILLLSRRPLRVSLGLESVGERNPSLKKKPTRQWQLSHSPPSGGAVGQGGLGWIFTKPDGQPCQQISRTSKAGTAVAVLSLIPIKGQIKAHVSANGNTTPSGVGEYGQHSFPARILLDMTIPASIIR
jgi:hypothetical protein